jgi:hypothetical protein
MLHVSSDITFWSMHFYYKSLSKSQDICAFSSSTYRVSTWTRLIILNRIRINVSFLLVVTLKHLFVTARVASSNKSNVRPTFKIFVTHLILPGMFYCDRMKGGTIRGSSERTGFQMWVQRQQMSTVETHEERTTRNVGGGVSRCQKPTSSTSRKRYDDGSKLVATQVVFAISDERSLTFWE